jgi:uncharacterized protein (TIRG00374 family)
MKKHTKKHILNIFIVVLLAVMMAAILVSSTGELNLANLREFFSDCNIFYIVLAFLCLLGFILFEALSLHIILKKLGYKPKFYSSIAYSTADTYYSAITPSASGGQPAAAYYMIKDGVSGGASGFSLVFNLVGYTAAILIIGVLGLIMDFNIFLGLSGFVKFIVILGFFSQAFLLVFFIFCMRYHTGVTKLGYFIVNFLSKIKIIKKKDKWLAKVDSTVDKYKNCYNDFRNNKKTFVYVLICNILQRVSQILISVFVCKSAIDCSFVEVFVMQTLVVMGYNSIPLPGGIGAFEYLYLKIYGLTLPNSFIIISMMVTRVISYYLSLIASGLYTITYHALQLRKKKKNYESTSEVVLTKETEAA